MIKVLPIFNPLRCLLIILCWMNLNDLSSQNINNPFEIKSRISDTIILKAIVDSTAILKLIEPTDSTELTVENTSDINPFEVNHIPLRRRDVRKESSFIIEENVSSKSYLFWTMLVGFILFTIAVSSNRKLIDSIIKSLFNENILKQNVKTNIGTRFEYLLLYVVFFIGGGGFLHLIHHHWFEGELSFFNLILCIGIVAGIYLIRHLSLWLLGFIFPLSKEASLYSFTIQVMNSILGVSLLVINLFVAFSTDNVVTISLYTGLTLIAILLIIRYIRGLTISIQYILGNIIPFFIYLCTLEIAPILVLVKLLEVY